MSNDIIHSKIELLEEQIENTERSGYFTESEIDRLSFPLREELESLKKQLNLYGMNQEKYNEGVKMHLHYFSQMHSPALKNTCQVLGIKLTKYNDNIDSALLLRTTFVEYNPELNETESSELKKLWSIYGRNLTSIQG